MRKALLIGWIALPLSWPMTATLAQPAPSDYWSDTWRGWHFYEDPEPPKVPPRRPQASSQLPPPNATKAPELEQFTRLQKDLEDYRNIAIINPTEANVRRYMALEARVTTQASRFADVAQRIAWATPELDPTLQGRPANAKALEVFERTQFSERQRSINQLSTDHVVLFFFRSDCPYCHAMAPTMQAFEAQHGIKVVAVSVDGGPMPGFPNARADNGIGQTLKVTQVPAVYLAQPYTGKITPIGFGVLSDTQLVERISLASIPIEAGNTESLAGPPSRP